MMSSSEIVLFALLLIFVLNNWLEQKLEDAAPIIHRMVKVKTVQPHDSASTSMATITDVEESPPSRMSDTDMKKALQQYLDDHLQQHTPDEPTLESHYSIEHNKGQGQTTDKKTKTSPVYGLENWGMDIQPFQMNASTFATI
jgi:hypothetical protein